jgi:hypothetical protein
MPSRSTCKLCTIHIIRNKKRPREEAMPCNIKGCPYERSATKQVREY